MRWCLRNIAVNVECELFVWRQISEEDILFLKSLQIIMKSKISYRHVCGVVQITFLQERKLNIKLNADMATKISV